MTRYDDAAAGAWQESWDRQQEAYIPDREERFAALLNAVDATSDGHPAAVLDLAGGTGSISLRTLRRFPQATTTLVDLDPVLMRIARDSLDERSAIVPADLRDPGWSAALPRHDYDAVLTATALHWLTPARLADLYAEVRTVLRPGGVFVNVDHMPDEGLPTLSGRLGDRARGVRTARYATGAVLSWEAWWDLVAKDPALGPLVEQRRALLAEGAHADTAEPATWHLEALRAAGFAEVGLVWRGGADAAVAAVR
jgi:SAM-dependent methyltransferase